MKTLLLFTLTLFSTFTLTQAQESKIDMHGDQALQKTPLYYGKVLEITSVKNYTYLKIDEKGQTLWIAIAKAEVSVGDKVGFDKQTLMTNFRSNTLNKTFERIYFVSEISLPRKQNLTMKEMLNLSNEGK